MQTGVVITGRGLVSSLAHDAVNSCAAARAGLLRATPIEGLKMASPATGEAEAVCAHQVAFLTKGFGGFARLLRLAQAGLLDLARNVQLPEAARIAAYLALPAPDRLARGLSLIDDDELRAEYGPPPPADPDAEPLEEDPDDVVVPPRPDELWYRAVDLVRAWKVAPSLRFVSTLGHAGFAEAALHASSDLAAGVVDVALVGGIDSLVDEPTLKWLDATARLKFGGRPTGLMPGEAAGFLALERSRDVRQRDGLALAELVAAPLASDRASLLEADPPTGKALGDSIAAHAGLAGWAQGQPAWLLSDMNGEDFRALELGHALTRLRAKFPGFADPAVWMPAVNFGDTASASGAVAANLVLSGFARGYAPAPAAVIASSSDARERCAILIKSYSTREK